MGNCSSCSGSCKDKETDKKCCDDCGDTCDDGKCNCKKKLDDATKLAYENNGMKCMECNDFSCYALPNRCNGGFYCFKCISTKAWKLPKTGWLKKK